MFNKMKFLLICFNLLEVLSLSNSFQKENSEDDKEWERFKESYQKVYTGKAEELVRREIYIENLNFIREHNKKYRNEEESYSVKENKYADLTNEEFTVKMNRYKSGTRKRTKEGHKHLVHRIHPVSTDWREVGAVTCIKNQGLCGSCWAYSAAGSIESHNFLKTGKLESLSEQYLIDCSGSTGNQGCSGGATDLAFQYIVESGGIALKESYDEKQSGNCNLASEERVKVKTFLDVPPSEAALTTAVATVGPVSVAIDASGSGFQFYHYGVYKSGACSKSNVTHGMVAVGYGTKHGPWLWDGDYWILKNSWGTSWGIDGYIWLARNMDNMCGIATEASYPVL